MRSGLPTSMAQNDIMGKLSGRYTGPEHEDGRRKFSYFLALLTVYIPPAVSLSSLFLETPSTLNPCSIKSNIYLSLTLSQISNLLCLKRQQGGSIILQPPSADKHQLFPFQQQNDSAAEWRDQWDSPYRQQRMCHYQRQWLRPAA